MDSKNTTTNRRVPGGVVAFIILIFVVGMYLLHGGDLIVGGAANVLPTNPQAAKERDFSGDGGIDQWAEAESAGERLEHYLEYSKYPDFSRPLNAGDVDLLDPYRPAGTETPLAQGRCLDGDAGRDCAAGRLFQEVRCTVEPESVMAIRKTDFAFRAYCFDPATQRNLDLSTFTSTVWLEKSTEQGVENIRRPGPIFFGDDGAHGDAHAGDRIYRIVVRLGPQDWGWMNLILEGEYGGAEVSTTGSTWFSTPHTVAEFETPLQDGVQFGSLIVRVPIQIYKAGYYEFNANLVQADDDREPVARSYKNQELTAGRHVIELLFFGKAIRDQGLDGPYLLTGLRARRNNAPVTPAELRRAVLTDKRVVPREEVMYQPMYEYTPLGAEYTTAPYAANEFSAKEWASEEKTKRIEMLERDVAESN